MRKKILLITLIIIGVCVLLEGVTRIIQSGRKVTIVNLKVNDRSFVRRSAAPDLGYELVPLFDESYEYRDRRQRVVRAVRYVINKNGQRDREFAFDRSAATRIVCLGDSFTFGFGINAEKTFPKLLEKALNESGHPEAEVINAGVPGYNTQQEIALYRHRLKAYDPDIVVLGYCLNDTDPLPELSFPSDDTVAMQVHRPTPFYFRPLIWSIHHSAFMHSLVQAHKNLLLAMMKGSAGSWNYDTRSWGSVRRALVEFARDLENEGKKLIVLLIPYEGYLDAIDALVPRKLLADATREEQIVFVDAFPEFSRVNKKERRSLFLSIDGHLDAAGHRIIADALRDAILRLRR
jgi:lysophospholipase L1-like esterase